MDGRYQVPALSWISGLPSASTSRRHTIASCRTWAWPVARPGRRPGPDPRSVRCRAGGRWGVWPGVTRTRTD